ncbi:MAG TPA: hypothetical protein VFQ61_38795 [Polyangiaceae bacterium]|nr:hypothetical protein [Polyangiaceae bacterium]
MAKAKAKSPRAASSPDQLLERARTTLQLDGVVKVAALGTATARAELVARLVSEGFEATKSVVRKPLRSQLLGALAEGAFIRLKSVGSHVAGASVPEAKRAAQALVQTGEAKLVVRGSEEVLVSQGASVLARDELKRFAEVAKAVAKVASSKSGASILRSDLAEDLARFMPGGAVAAQSRVRPAEAGSQPSSERVKAETDPMLGRLFSAVDAARDPGTGLSFVPAIVATLSPDLKPEAASALLFSAAQAGLLELRPEGGIQRLSDEELAVCPPGPQGTRLSWARRTNAVVE